MVVGLIRAAKASAQEPAQVLAELRKRILESGAHRYDVPQCGTGPGLIPRFGTRWDPCGRASCDLPRGDCSAATE